MEAKVVVDLGFGDGGKGITTDFLASNHSNSIVVRYCGGHQAGHNVIKDGVQHIFSSYCSGALRGRESYISEYCCFYPPYLELEGRILATKTPSPTLTIHPLAKLTTPYDIAYNRLLEKRSGHGSVGVGIGTTMQRNLGPYKLHAIDTTNRQILEQKLAQVRGYYQSEMWQYNAKELKYYSDIVNFEMSFFMNAIESMNVQIRSYDYLRRFSTIIFEGAQGILLDMDFGIFPNVTYGYTSSKNAISICNLLDIEDIAMFYVTRCYLTRHGNGWMPNETPVKLINNEQEINIFNEWQGNFKTGELDYDLLNYALDCDNVYSGDRGKSLVITCLDQRPDFKLDKEKFKRRINYWYYGSHSPDSKDFKII